VALLYIKDHSITCSGGQRDNAFANPAFACRRGRVRRVRGPAPQLRRPWCLPLSATLLTEGHTVSYDKGWALPAPAGMSGALPASMFLRRRCGGSPRRSGTGDRLHAVGASHPSPRARAGRSRRLMRPLAGCIGIARHVHRPLVASHFTLHPQRPGGPHRLLSRAEQPMPDYFHRNVARSTPRRSANEIGHPP
jgi:hypothetical protein